MIIPCRSRSALGLSPEEGESALGELYDRPLRLKISPRTQRDFSRVYDRPFSGQPYPRGARFPPYCFLNTLPISEDSVVDKVSREADSDDDTELVSSELLSSDPS